MLDDIIDQMHRCNEAGRYRDAITLGVEYCTTHQQVADEWQPSLETPLPKPIHFYVMVLRQLVVSYRQTEDADNYVRCLEYLHALVPSDPVPPYKLGDFYAHHRGYQNAKTAYKWFLRSNELDQRNGKRDPITMTRLARVAKSTHQHELAAEWLEKVIEVEPDNKIVRTNLAHMYLGLAYQYLNRKEDFVRRAEEHMGLIEPDLNDIFVLTMWVKYYSAMGQHEQAIELAEELLKQRPDADNDILLVTTVIHSGDTKRAIALADIALQKDGTNYMVRESRARALFADRRFAEALSSLEADILSERHQGIGPVLYLDMALVAYKAGYAVNFGTVDIACRKLRDMRDEEGLKWALCYKARFSIAQEDPEMAVRLARQAAVLPQYNRAAMMILRHLALTQHMPWDDYARVCKDRFRDMPPEEYRDMMHKPEGKVSVRSRNQMDEALREMSIFRAWFSSDGNDSASTYIHVVGEADKREPRILARHIVALDLQAARVM